MFKNQKIGTKLYLLIGGLSILLVAVGVLGLKGEKKIYDSLESIYNDQLVPATLLSQMGELRNKNIQEQLLAQLHDPKLPVSKLHEMDHPISKHIDAIEENVKKLDNLWEQFMATALTAEEKQLAEKYAAGMSRYGSEGQRPMILLLKAKQFDDASLHFTNKALPLFEMERQDFHELIDFQVNVAKKEIDADLENYVSDRSFTIAGLVGGILLASGIGFWIIRGITGRVVKSVSTLSASATQIAATMVEHERTVGEQSAAVTEVSVTTDELSASALTSSQQAESAAASANQARELTENGIKLASRAYSGMGEMKTKVGAVAGQILHLSEQAEQIGSIAKVVGSLASETNMLALNAAVEAARAGEHGKGFAVVASEIRKLADESKKSAERANALVAEIQRATNSAVMATEEGTKKAEEVAVVAQQAGESFAALENVANKVYENAQQVMHNSKQQSSALTQVSEAMKSLSVGSKEIAAGTVQTRTAVVQLNEVAHSLRALV